MTAPRKPRQAREGIRNAVHKIVQPVAEVTVDPAVMAAVRVILGPGGDYRRVRILDASTVRVENQPRLADEE